MPTHIQRIYTALLEQHGPQGWWPVFDKRTKCCAYHLNAPRDENDILEICIGAILTQNTAWSNVEKALGQLHQQNLMSLGALLNANHEKLATAIRSAGYFNQKTERLKILAEFLQQQSIKQLQKKETQELRKMLLAVKGIGPETADSMLLYAFKKPSFVVDTYTKRIFSRYSLCKENVDYHKLQQLITASLPKDVQLYNEYHALIVEHAKVCCQKNGSKEGCVIKNSLQRILKKGFIE